jgi:hypothetical protein
LIALGIKLFTVANRGLGVILSVLLMLAGAILLALLLQPDLILW